MNKEEIPINLKSFLLYITIYHNMIYFIRKQLEMILPNEIIIQFDIKEFIILTLVIILLFFI